MSEWDAVARLAVAAILGGIIGFERETLDKAAGLRTHMLVALGSALFMVSSVLLVQEYATFGGEVRVDPTRIASTIVTGIGFLGGGLIFRANERVHGLTTAAGLWVAAATGLATGAGYYITAVGSVVLAIVVLVVMRRLEMLTHMKPARPPHELPPPLDDQDQDPSLRERS